MTKILTNFYLIFS